MFKHPNESGLLRKLVQRFMGRQLIAGPRPTNLGFLACLNDVKPVLPLRSRKPSTMAEDLPENPQPADGDLPAELDMDVDAGSAEDPAESAEGAAKREREEGAEDGAENGAQPKKRTVERSFEEERMQKLEGNGEEVVVLEKRDGDDEERGEGEGELEAGGIDDDKAPACTTVGPKVFTSSVDMFDYFYKFLHSWSTNLDINKYEHMVLLDLLKKGNPEPQKKIGVGIQAFQVRFHPTWKSKCFFLIRVDGTVDDFSFRKCVDNILPLPEQMKAHLTSGGNKATDDNKARNERKDGHDSSSSGRGGRGNGRGGRGNGRGGRGGRGHGERGGRGRGGSGGFKRRV
ncbi:high mobility group nucleosome-binding domain-containing protein 5-like [Canna indica]|uniref:High mobility group nucleosome-binding domain-containing protein 5-like n=1 Tax=Canna indica TaxID=4628 RepID=A0AAQ3K6A3_9LILI|nr:high mobility group nucleosome-binding domain-containing protein 5-like [Canna indica]